MMSRRSRCCWAGMLLAMGVGLGVIQGASGAASGVANAAERSSGARSKSKGSAESAAPSFRLPRYFSSIVDDQQRSKIRQIQISFHDKMEPLREELAELEAAQLDAIEKLLSSSQRKTLEQLRAGESTRSSGKTGRTSRASSSRSKKSSAKSSSSRSTSSKSGSGKSGSSKSGKSGSARGAKAKD